MLATVALVVLGPNRLPGAARTLGRLIGQMRSMSTSFQAEVRDALHDPQDAFSSAVAEFKPGDLHPGRVRQSVRRAVADTLAPPTPSNGAAGPTPAPPPAYGPPGAGALPDDPGFN